MDPFTEVASRYGVGMQGVAWSTFPHQFAEECVRSVKVYAQHLKKARLTKTHTAGLEAVSRAAGFQHWHELRSILDSLQEAPEATELPERAAGLIPFMVGAAVEVAPVPGVVLAFQEVAKRLSVQLGSAPEVVLEVIAQMHKCSSWSELLSREAADAVLPLYEFVLNDDGRQGEFVESSACRKLVMEQDRLFQGYRDRSAAEKQEFEEWIKALLRKQPGFLEGWLAQGTVYEMSDRDEAFLLAGPCYDEGIARAHELIPKDFKGEILWDVIENRFYHRMLYASMVFKAFEGNLSTAVALARRQLAANPNDNLGVRLWLVVLLAGDGQVRSLGPAIKRLGDVSASDAGVELPRAIGSFAVGDMAGAASSLIRALLLWPPFRWILLSNRDMLAKAYGNRSNSRGVIPDFQVMWQQFHLYASRNPSFTNFAEELAHDSRFTALESESATRFFAATKARDEGQPMESLQALYEKWHSGVLQGSLDLGGQLAVS